MEDNDLEDEEEGRLTEGFVERKPRGHRHEDKESKKVIFRKKNLSDFVFILHEYRHAKNQQKKMQGKSAKIRCQRRIRSVS